MNKSKTEITPPPAVAIFASGTGSNAKKIHQYGVESGAYRTGLVVTNRRKAGVLSYCKENKIPAFILTRESFYERQDVLDVLKRHEITLIALAGFLWLIPPYLIDAYPGRIINIHPALLPRYGGKGMYGPHVHQAVFDNKEEKSGITIHFVNEEYDKGNLLLQASQSIKDCMSPVEIGRRILRMEHTFYPLVVAGLSSHLNSSGTGTAAR